jgi:hypothetical protein
MTVKEVPIESPVEEKIAWAKNCFRERGTDLLRDEEVGILLKKLKRAINASHSEMAHTGIIEFCSRCEQEEGGSCCGIGLEKKYTGVLLLINLLLGCPIPGRRQNPSSCFFLGKEGCGLLSRQVICINYLCKKITDQIEPHKIAPLRKKEGIELDLLFHLNERIKKVLAKPKGRE